MASGSSVSRGGASGGASGGRTAAAARRTAEAAKQAQLKQLKQERSTAAHNAGRSRKPEKKARFLNLVKTIDSAIAALEGRTQQLITGDFEDLPF